MSAGPIKYIVGVISDAVVARLAAAAYPQLIDGQILLGAQYVFEQSAPPRIIFVPTDDDYGEVDVYNNEESVTPYGVEAKAQIAQRSIATDFLRFQIRCWGVGDDPDDDFDMTRTLAHAVIQSLRDCIGPFTRGGHELLKGKWTDANYGSQTQLIKHGREYVFGVSIATPVLDSLLQFPGAGVHAVHTGVIESPTGQTEVGC